MDRTRNPTRRNRNIGTAKQGQGQDNRLVIPAPLNDDRIYWECLRERRIFKFQVHGEERVALIEAPRGDYFYGCTPWDVLKLLSMLPPEHLDGLDLFLFRHPTRKQRTLEPVWGRFLYFATPGKHEGSAICFESQDLQPYSCSRSVDPERARENARLERDGHKLVDTGRALEFHRTRESIRNTVLYRTAIHEVGHYYDWLKNVLEPIGERTELEEEEAQRDFDTKVSAVREDFAHRYAHEAAERLRNEGKLPFEPQWDSVAASNLGIEPKWFGLSELEANRE